MCHKSDSTEQTQAEYPIRNWIQKELNVTLESKELNLNDGCKVQIDAYSEKERILCDIYARIGELKPGQDDKVAVDILKLIYVSKSLGGKWRKIFCFTDKRASKKLTGNGWIAKAAKKFGVKVMVAPQDDAENKKRIATQKRQAEGNSSKPVK